ncbi:hypothetical protein V6N11_024293 [Hibiscus sabdariffa]|uniref:Uncharacterized protein n=1 Tax=Hibiscus sabdariffa TaxID=183260 RepID=A0ABR2N7S2_9ROSI
MNEFLLRKIKEILKGYDLSIDCQSNKANIMVGIFGCESLFASNMTEAQFGFKWNCWIQGNGNYQWNSVRMILKLELRV